MIDPDLIRLLEQERAAMNGKHDAEPFALEVLTAAETCALPDPPASDELLGPMLQRGNRLVLGGGTGEGKTTLALAIVRAVVRGEQFLDWRGSGGRVLVLDAEQGLKSVKRRLSEAGLEECGDVDYVRVPDGLALDSDPRHVAEVERVLTDGGYSVVVADPLYKLHAGDSNAEREAVDLMKRFDGWREQLRFALIMPVHLRKPPPGAKFSLNEVFGSTAYLRGCEVALGLQRLRVGYSRLHWLKDRDGDLPIGEAWGLLFDRESGFRRDPEDGVQKPTTADEIRDLIEQEPGLTTNQLMATTGRVKRTVLAALKSLDAESSAGPHGQKQWRLRRDPSEPSDLELGL